MTREERYIEYDERIDRYLRNQMTDSERTAFEQDVEQDQELRERLVATSLLVQGIAEEGMRREGQYQLDTISKMSLNEFEQASKGKKNTIIRWATGIAAIGIIALFLPVLFTTHSDVESVVACEEVCDTAIELESPITIKQPTLASLAKDYNRPIAGESDEFVAIRKQIQNGDSKEEMMAVVYDIDKIQEPTYNEGAMGAENAEVIKEMQQMHIDCVRWYKAMAYLKANDKNSAIRELEELNEHGTVEELVNRATKLLKELNK